jgi:hypothetical protein
VSGRIGQGPDDWEQIDQLDLESGWAAAAAIDLDRSESALAGNKTNRSGRVGTDTDDGQKRTSGREDD